jgi:hypothetical protein
LRVTALAALLAVAALPHGSGAIERVQDPGTPTQIRELRVEEWILIVEAHEPGRTDEALRRLQSWTTEQLDQLIVGLHEAFGRPNPLPTRSPARLLRRGAALHADLAILAPFHESAAATPQQSLATRSLVADDGRSKRLGSISAHWQIGRQLTDFLVTPDGAPDEFVRLWYHATTEFMIANADYAATGPHLRRARQLLPRDAHLCVAAGAVRAAYAAPAVQNAATSTRWMHPVLVNDRWTELVEAERLLERAIELDSGNAEAHLRYGWVRFQQRHIAAALAALRIAREAATDVVLQYYANLFLGAAETAADRLDDAAAAFKEAGRLFPAAQSPSLALSELALRRGDRAGAQAALDQWITQPTHGGDDPWWTYDVAFGRSWRRTLAAMHVWLLRVER